MPLRTHQMPPASAWEAWVILGLRGAGKTFAGAVWLSSEALRGPAGELALVGSDLAVVRDILVPAVIEGARTGERPTWSRTQNRLTWPNGATCTALSTRMLDSLEGRRLAAAWLDEPAHGADLRHLRAALLPSSRVVITSCSLPAAVAPLLVDRVVRFT